MWNFYCTKCNFTRDVYLINQCKPFMAHKCSAKFDLRLKCVKEFSSSLVFSMYVWKKNRTTIVKQMKGKMVHNLKDKNSIFDKFDQVSQPHFGLSGRMKLTLPKVGTWSPLGLLKTQSLSSRVKHLALGCSLYHWKGLEVQMPKMASHEPFGHMQPKLWAKEGPGVKLAI